MSSERLVAGTVFRWTSPPTHVGEVERVTKEHVFVRLDGGRDVQQWSVKDFERWVSEGSIVFGTE